MQSVAGDPAILRACGCQVRSLLTSEAQVENSTIVTIGGTLSGLVGTEVELYNGSTALGAATMNGSGGWTYTISLTPGRYDLGATATDLAGNVGTSSGQVLAVRTTPVNNAPAPITLGSGSSDLTLQVSEDAWNGDAQFTVSVDGTQIGGTQTATASHAAGAMQTVNVMGDYAPGQHSVAVDFLNDAYGGSPMTDRNLYVDSAALDDANVAGSTLTLMSAGSQGFSFTEPAAVGASGTSGANQVTGPTSAPIVIGAGTDLFVLGVSEDAWQGDAQFTVRVDGTQVGGTETATSSHTAGAIQSLTVNGNWGAGTHTIGIDFINDAYGDAPTADRNLYVHSASYDGNSMTPGSATLYSNGTTNFTGSANGPVTLLMSEDAYQGDAQYAVSLDGKPVGGTGTVTASHSAGQTQSVNLAQTLTAGVRDVALSFLNDLYGGSPSTDRNLYVNAVQVNGTAVPKRIGDTLQPGHGALLGNDPNALSLTLFIQALGALYRCPVFLGSTAMAGVPAGLPAGVRVSDHISLGVIAKTFLPDRCRRCWRRPARRASAERDLPAHVMVYYAIAMALYTGLMSHHCWHGGVRLRLTLPFRRRSRSRLRT